MLPGGAATASRKSALHAVGWLVRKWPAASSQHCLRPARYAASCCLAFEVPHQHKLPPATSAPAAVLCPARCILPCPMHSALPAVFCPDVTTTHPVLSCTASMRCAPGLGVGAGGGVLIGDTLVVDKKQAHLRMEAAHARPCAGLGGSVAGLTSKQAGAHHWQHTSSRMPPLRGRGRSWC